MKTPREYLELTIWAYNKSVNNMSKFKFNERETELFAKMIEDYAKESLLEHIPKFMRWCDEGANIEVEDADFEAFKEIANSYIESEIIKPSNDG